VKDKDELWACTWRRVLAWVLCFAWSLRLLGPAAESWFLYEEGNPDIW